MTHQLLYWIDSERTRQMFAHKCYFSSLRLKTLSSKSLMVGTDLGFLKDGLWFPMLRKNLMKSQPTTKDHLGINRKSDSPEAILYRGSRYIRGA